jgi:hypothetical protein
MAHEGMMRRLSPTTMGARLSDLVRQWSRLIASPEGAPFTAVAAAALLAILALVVIAAVRQPAAVRGYAEFSAFRYGCSLQPSSLNVLRCRRVGPNLYVLDFSESLAGSTAVISRSTCCGGPSSAGIDPRNHREVVVSFPRQHRYPVIASVVVP